MNGVSKMSRSSVSSSHVVPGPIVATVAELRDFALMLSRFKDIVIFKTETARSKPGPELEFLEQQLIKYIQIEKEVQTLVDKQKQNLYQKDLATLSEILQPLCKFSDIHSIFDIAMIKFFRIPLLAIYHGMGHYLVLSYSTEYNRFFIKMNGGSNGWDREINEKKYYEDSLQEQPFYNLKTAVEIFLECKGDKPGLWGEKS